MKQTQTQAGIEDALKIFLHICLIIILCIQLISNKLSFTVFALHLNMNNIHINLV